MTFAGRDRGDTRGVSSLWRNLWLLPVCLLLLSACRGQVHSATDHITLTLTAGDLEKAGIALISPSAAQGHEEDRQALAFTFGRVFAEQRPEVSVISLHQSLGAINENGLAEAYKLMYVEYSGTGVFNRDILSQIGEAIGSRYVLQLQLAGFSQFSSSRLNALGVRLIQTNQATIRLFAQIWDTETGRIVWEGSEELNRARDTFTSQPIGFNEVVAQSAKELIARMP